MVVKWHAALALHRVTFFSDHARATHTHTCMVDFACALHGALGTASKWKVYVGDAVFAGLLDFSGEDVSQKRSSEVRTVAHAREHGLTRYKAAANVTSLHDFLDYLKRLDRGSSLIGMCQR